MRINSTPYEKPRHVFYGGVKLFLYFKINLKL